jgi:hypothetical protein
MVDKELARLFRLHYSRGAGSVSPHRFKSGFTRPASLALLIGLAAAASAQYPGQIQKTAKDTPTLRAIGVLEWTGDEGKPKKSRLVPITVYDGEALQDGNVYLARPEPLALGSEVEYVLQKNGKQIGLYDIKNAGLEEGMWVGFGSWKPMPHPKLATPKPIDDSGFDANDDKPVLHRRHDSDSGTSSGSQSSAPADPDRPALHKKSDSDDSADSSAPAPDPDRPQLHKDSTDSGNKPAPDSDRPVLHKPDEASAGSADGEHTGVEDPNRPHLIRGRPAGSGPDVLPSLMGLPAEMEQVVAVSDAKSHPEHTWDYTWANPADEDKMKEGMEEIARKALGLQTPQPPPTPKRASTKTRTKAAPPTKPLPLVDEHFRVFELTYGGGATMVLSARTDGPPKEQKFVTLIAQPDLYGNVLVLFKNVTDSAHLDETPRMRLIDAVDALADNRGELLFELRGSTQRQFALYRVLRGSAEKIFVTGGGEFGLAPGM